MLREIPARTLAVDLVGLGVLGALALFGFRNTYGGTRYFLAGVVGLALGMAVAWLGARRRLGALVTAALAVLGYLVVGGVVVAPAKTIAGFIPRPASLAAMVDGAVAGWARLLTSQTPVGEADNLLAVPLLSGLLCGLLALTVSLRSRKPLFALVFPTALLALGILFGTQKPASQLLQGAVFAVVALSWASYRYQTRRRIDTGRRRSTRWIGIVAMLGLAGFVAAHLGDGIPGAGSPRVVLRDDIDPPFDPNDYPSPLAGYRRFTNGLNKDGPNDPRPTRAGWRHTELFEVRGLPADEPLRLATLDTYDGTVYRVGEGAGSSGYFQRVGESVTPDPDATGGADGEQRTVEITVLEGRQVPGTDPEASAKLKPRPYGDIWLPLPEHPTSVVFDGDDTARNEDLASSLRMNVQTGAAVVPVRGGTNAGDSYTVTFTDIDHPDLSKLENPTLSEEVSLPKPYAAEQVQGAAAMFSRESIDCDKDAAGSTGDQQADSDKPGGDNSAGGAPAGGTPAGETNPVRATALLGAKLRNCGGLDDGVQGHAGHTAARLDQMIPSTGGVMLGNGEQFAPLAALMADAIGADARVVMGFRSREASDKWREEHPDAGLSPSDDDVYRVAGTDIDAWIEINVAGHGWVPVEVTPDTADPFVMPRPQSTRPKTEPPPPPPSIPPSDDDEADTTNANPQVSCEQNPDQDKCKPQGGGFPWGTILKYASIPMVPVAVVSLITGVIAALKARRRKHRRYDGPADVRVNGGWQEITDLACDLGSPVPPRVTRREAAGLIANDDATHLARHADGAVFGPYDLADADVERYWNEVDAVRASMVSGLSRFGRWKVLVSLSSLRLNAQRNRALRRAARARKAAGQPPADPPQAGGPPSGSVPEPQSPPIAANTPLGGPLWSPDVAGGTLR